MYFGDNLRGIGCFHGDAGVSLYDAMLRKGNMAVKCGVPAPYLVQSCYCHDWLRALWENLLTSLRPRFPVSKMEPMTLSRGDPKD